MEYIIVCTSTYLDRFFEKKLYTYLVLRVSHTCFHNVSKQTDMNTFLHNQTC